MKKTIFLLLFSVFSFFALSETVVCPHCGKSFEYTKNPEVKKLNSVDYEILTVPRINMFYEKYIKNGTLICLKDVTCSMYSNTIFFLHDMSSHDSIRATFIEDVAEPNTDEKLVELLEDFNNRADFYGYLQEWRDTFYLVIMAIRTQADYIDESLQDFLQGLDLEDDTNPFNPE